jgi:hypothetical protein
VPQDLASKQGTQRSSPTTIPTRLQIKLTHGTLLGMKQRAERLREQAKEDAGADAGGKPPGTGRGEDVEALQWATTLVFWSGMGKPS